MHSEKEFLESLKQDIGEILKHLPRQVPFGSNPLEDRVTHLYQKVLQRLEKLEQKA